MFRALGPFYSSVPVLATARNFFPKGYAKHTTSAVGVMMQ